MIESYVHVIAQNSPIFKRCLQSRSQGLTKQLQDTYEQIEQTFVEAKTFDALRQHEVGAIPKRMEVRYSPT